MVHYHNSMLKLELLSIFFEPSANHPWLDRQPHRRNRQVLAWAPKRKPWCLDHLRRDDPALFGVFKSKRLIHASLLGQRPPQGGGTVTQSTGECLGSSEASILFHGEGPAGICGASILEDVCTAESIILSTGNAFVTSNTSCLAAGRRSHDLLCGWLVHELLRKPSSLPGCTLALLFGDLQPLRRAFACATFLKEDPCPSMLEATETM